MIFNLITIFPQIFNSYLNESILKRAQNKNLIKINPVNLRDFTTDKHHTTDDAPYGGGPGMVMKIEPLYQAILALRKKYTERSRQRVEPALTSKQKIKHRIILLSPQGQTFNQKMAEKFSKLDVLTLICGRYEGFDARLSKFVDEEISIGDYVLSGGELPALVLVEAVSRLRPGVLGAKESIQEETFTEKNILEYPQYTRPEVFTYPDFLREKKSLAVPKILLSGDHAKISAWRQKHLKIKKK